MASGRQSDVVEPLLAAHNKADKAASKAESLPAPKTSGAPNAYPEATASSCLSPVTAADLPAATHEQLSKLNRTLTVWHRFRHTEWLWLFVSLLAIFASPFTIYHMGLGMVPGLLGEGAALWGLQYLRVRPAQQLDSLTWFFKAQCVLAYVTAAYAVMLGITIIVFEVVCFKGEVRCELLDMGKSARYLQILMGVGFIALGAISIAVARNASDAEAAGNDSSASQPV